MSRVFIINDLNHNFNSAARFGTLINVTEGRVPFFKTDVMYNILREGLAGFTEDDYLLVSGPQIVCMMTVLVILDMHNHKHPFEGLTYIKTLLYDAKEQGYVVRHLPV